MLGRRIDHDRRNGIWRATQGARCETASDVACWERSMSSSGLWADDDYDIYYVYNHIREADDIPYKTR